MTQTSPRERDETGVDAAAAQLANAIKARPEWRALTDARTRFRTDVEMTAIMARYRRAFDRWKAARARGEHLPGPDAIELAEAQDALQRHPLFQRQHEATEALIAVLHEVNRVLSAELELDFAANAAPPSACCG